MLSIGGVGTLALGSIWLAFFPPEHYARWIQARSQGALAASVG